jgi:hypothetical protein
MNTNGLAGLRIEISQEVRARHLQAMGSALARPVVRRAPRRVVLALAALLVIIPLASLAAESSVPGEVLHPIKRLVEPLRIVLDRDVVARHRVEELEVLIARKAPPALIDRSVRAAQSAVADRPLLRPRLEQALALLDQAGVNFPGTATTGTTEPAVNAIVPTITDSPTPVIDPRPTPGSPTTTTVVTRDSRP